VKIIYRKKEWELEGEWRVRDAIVAVGLTPRKVIPIRDRQMVPEDEIVGDGDIIKLVPVISGG
jgi:sulfur carrier protein ThiS